MQVCSSSGAERDGTVKRSDVINLLIAEYDYNTDIEVQREEAFGQGEAKGRVEDPDYQKELIKEYGIIE